MNPTVPPFPELQAHPSWECVEFISDLHLHPDEGATTQAWQNYLQQTAADAVFILGDLFEVWVGDDVALTSSFEAECLVTLAQAATQRPIFFMHGNRDFLVAQGFAAQTHIGLLADPTVLCFAGTRYLLSHGDALCLDDTAYQTFRAEVRSVAWQETFLAKPLSERTHIARDIRSQSEAKKRTQNTGSCDLDTHAVKQWLTQAQAPILVHGHTHHPADHDLGDRQQRVVLSDWDLAATPPRAQILRLEVQTGQANARNAPERSRINLA